MSIVPSFCTTVSWSVKNCFRRGTKSTGPKVKEVVSSSPLSPEIEARVQGLPFMWRPKCRTILRGQTLEVQREQISVWEQLPDFTKTSTWPPASTIFKELVTVSMPMTMPTVVVEADVNMDVCSNWFRDVEYEDEDEDEDDDDDEFEEEEEELEDDANLRWFPREFIVPQMDHLPPRLCQVATSIAVVVENAPSFPEYKALPSLPSPPSSLIPLPLDVAEPLRPNGILGASIPLPVVFQPSHPKKMTSRPISYSGRWLSYTQEKSDRKPLGQHIPNQQEDNFRKLQGVSSDDFAKDLDKRHKTFKGTKPQVGQLPVSVLPARPTSTTKRKVIGTSTRRSYLSRRSTSSKENWHQVEAAPLRKHIPTTLGVVSPEVEDAEFQWCHLAMDISYGNFANELDERRMSIDDAFVTQDWDY